MERTKGFIVSKNIEDAEKYDKIVFVLAKTSNPGASFLQDLRIGKEFLYEKIAHITNEMGKSLRGRYGYSNIGIVVGATYPSDLRDLRKKFPHLFFLVPGYGTQGGEIQDFPEGMIINVSRSLIYAFEKDKEKKDYKIAIRKMAIKILNEIPFERKIA